MAWSIRYTEKAKQDLSLLDNSVRKQLLKVVDRVAKNPLPSSQGGYGKPLGNNQSSKLSGCLKIKLKSIGLRVVYKLVLEDESLKQEVGKRIKKRTHK